MSRIIFFDLDSTLATGLPTHTPTEIGDPVIPMLRVLFAHLKQGDTCVVHTARLSMEHTPDERAASESAIKDWCRKWIGRELPVTANKSYLASIFYDDRAVGIVKDQGVRADGKDFDV